MMGVQFLPPDFMIVGTPYKDGVMLIVSTNINHATLTAEYRKLWDLPPWESSAFGTSPEIELKANLRQFTLIIAKTYDEAIAKLLKEWQPPTQAGRPAVDQGRLAIEAPTEI